MIAAIYARSLIATVGLLALATSASAECGDVQFTDDYVFALTKEPGSVVVFRLEMYAGDRLAANDYRWDFVCDEESAPSKVSKGTK